MKRTIIFCIVIISIGVINYNCNNDDAINKPQLIVNDQSDCPWNEQSTVFLSTNIPNCTNCYAINLSSGEELEQTTFYTESNGSAIIDCLGPGTWRFCVNCSPNGSVQVTCDGVSDYWVSLTTTQCR